MDRSFETLSSPYFPPGDIENILQEIRFLLEGCGSLTMGEHAKAFEQEFSTYLICPYSVVTNSCTSALEISLRALNIREGDEVIVPIQTFIATGSAVLMSGAKVVLCDVNSDFLIDFDDLKSKITSRTKAVIMVHFAGLIHPMIHDIKDYLRGNSIYLIEDAAHALGARHDSAMAGTLGTIGCFSFYATKNITTGEGGMIATSDKVIYESCASIRNRGIDLSASQEIFSNIGSNRRFTEIQALLGRYQLRRLDEFIEKRNTIAKIYKEILESARRRGIVRFQAVQAGARHAYWRFVIFLEDCSLSREDLKRELQTSGIKIDWPYDPPLCLQPIFQKLYTVKVEMFPGWQLHANKHFCLPMHVQISVDEAVFVATKLKNLLCD